MEHSHDRHRRTRRAPVSTSVRRAARPPVYDAIGTGYARCRQPDPRFARPLHAALGDASTVLNVGAGAGSYEPADRSVVAVEPSGVMLSQRPPGGASAV